jgi:molybdopterin molybdotransferase
MFKPSYTPFDQALKTVLESAKTTPLTEHIPLGSSMGRVLAENVYADREVPPFNRVAMDGFACKRADLALSLDIIETVSAGHMPKKSVESGKCSKVMTGCILPDGADMVVMVELSKIDSKGRVSFDHEDKRTNSTNVALKGEDSKKGDLFVEKGTLIEPKISGILAAVGAANPLVYKTPLVGIIITGDEVLEPDKTPLQHQIRNSNGIQLITQTVVAGGNPQYYGIIADDKKALNEIFSKAVKECDLILFSGGVSMGEFDFVPEILTNNGFKILFNKVASKPGRPTTFAVSKDKWCFGMPGNPVTSFVVFELMVREFIGKLTGLNKSPVELKLPLNHDLQVKKSERITWLPALLQPDGSIKTITYHGSGHLHALRDAFGLVKINPNDSFLKKGQFVDVRPI